MEPAKQPLADKQSFAFRRKHNTHFVSSIASEKYRGAPFYWPAMSMDWREVVYFKLTSAQLSGDNGTVEWTFFRVSMPLGDDLLVLFISYIQTEM